MAQAPAVRTLQSDDPPGRLVLVVAPSGDQREAYLRRCLHELGGAPGSSFYLRCDFDQGGPWAGVNDLFREILPDLRASHPDLLDRHSYELVHVLPELRGSLEVTNPTLTDVAPTEEKVRNYPADRAFRIVHGLIDLMDAWSRLARRESWLLACDGFDRCGHIGERFFGELYRRRGRALRLSLIAGVSSEEFDHPRVFSGSARSVEIQRPLLDDASQRPGLEPEEDATAVRERAQELEREVGEDQVQIQMHLPALIRLWKQAGDDKKHLSWRCWGLEIYNTLGFYEDALRYGEGALREARELAPDNHEVHWSIFVKLFMSLAGLGRAEEALELAEQVRGDFTEPHKKARLFYLMAMLYGRFLPNRDLERAEEFLESGLRELETSDLARGEMAFQTVFNRNGLAMVRTFQNRLEEALDLCRTGYDMLSRELRPDQHRLHRSVLLYNMAQVHMAIDSYDEAVRAFSEAIEMDPHYSEYYNERGSAYLRLGRLEEALADFLRAKDLSPPYFELYSNLGECYRMRGPLERALEWYDRSLDLRPDHFTARSGRADVLQSLGRLDEAIEDFRELVDAWPERWEVRANYAILLYEQGAPADAAEQLDRAVESAPEIADLYFNRAAAREALGDVSGAIDDLTRCLALAPVDEDTNEVRSRIDELQGRAEISREAKT